MRASLSRRHPPTAQVQHGLTLVELLVSMVILGFVMLLVSETVKQVAQVARAADDTTRGFSQRWAGGWTASGLFANLVIPPEAGEQAAFKGDPKRVEGYTLKPLSGSDAGMAAFALELQPSADGARTELTTLLDGDTGVNQRTAAVARFAGRAEFAYVDRLGRTQSAWPPVTRAGDTPEELPRVVVIRDVATSGILMWFDFPGEHVRQRSTPGLFTGARPQ